MYESTKRFLDVAWQLQSIGIRYEEETDPDLAVLISFQDAWEIYHDLIQDNNFEIYRYAVPEYTIEKKHMSYPNLAPPPFPDGKRVVWCSIEGVKIAIKGTEDE